MILLVRHAIAVPRKDWTGTDDRRPLTPRGERQAETLPKVLSPYAISAVVSSPTGRCRATVAAIADERDLAVTTSRWMREGRGANAVDLVLDAAEDVVFCTHGDVLDEVLRTLRHLGWPVPARPRRAKGSTWLLRPDACEYLAPPA